MRIKSIYVDVAEKVAWLPRWEGADLSASLSTNSVLCAGKWGEVFLVAHLPSQRVARIAGDGDAIHSFMYRHELFVAQWCGAAPLRHAPMKRVLADRTHLAEFKHFTFVRKWDDVSCLDAAPTRGAVVDNHNDRE
eukprot:gnl/Chilomastix_cuspidata/6319.p3 GENE.gnl/Chilomastix_cuspidata/6319~~gnl/Chilomastix_cuspidata/6319.p3  ORF type:complete len:135 (-),score=19.15 gnl/Chilomastix_cuspidata/6319:591-995(-)